ncbi:hypothetical protein [Olsenella intestinalis]|uniref:hypothetical protein n=1 Tax=Olsenella intestinalis TaxID=2930083 RepID=UPI00200DA1D4|nr:hypothetical protein [Olsenella intestinalis]
MASRRHAYARREERASRAHARSERGASFVVALLLMLVCSVVAAVIVTSSAVSAERSRKTLEEQQAYLAVSSAIQAVRTLCADSGPVADLVLTRADSSSDFSAGSTSDGTPLAQWAASAANSARAGSTPTQTFKAAGFTHADATVPDVDLEFQMMPAGSAEQYKIKVVARLSANADHERYANAISTTIDATLVDDKTLYWGSGPVPEDTPAEAPQTNTTVYDTPYMSDVWGIAHDAWWEKQWQKCKWKATANSELFIASNPSHYIVTIYYRGAYYIPVCNAPAGSIYDGRAMAAKVNNLDDERMLTDIPADGQLNCERRIINPDGSEPEETTKNSLRDFTITWKKVS